MRRSEGRRVSADLEFGGESRYANTWTKVALARQVVVARNWNAAVFAEGGYGWSRSEQIAQTNASYWSPQDQVETWCVAFGLRLEAELGWGMSLVSGLGVERVRHLGREEHWSRTEDGFRWSRNRVESSRFDVFGGLGTESHLKATLVYSFGD